LASPAERASASAFEAHRPALLALAYKMLGELSGAEDVVQEAWLRWQRRPARVESPRAFLLTTVTHLCLDELGSARARREQSRGDRLPEPIDLDRVGLGQVERLDQISLAFLVLLQRLTPAERAVLLLHDVLDLSHAEIAATLDKTEAACRQILKRARANVAEERRALRSSPEELRRILGAFVRAVREGDQAALVDMLAEDAVLTADGGPVTRRFGSLRNLRRPVRGRKRIVALVQAFGRQGASARLEYRERTLNGQPAMVVFLDGRPLSAMVVSLARGKIRRLFFQGDPARLRRLRPA